MATIKPFFTPQKEIDFFDKVNEELIDDLVGQAIDIYKVSLSETEENMYGEAASGKTFDRGYRVNCLIQFNEPETSLNEFGSDVNASIEIYFHRNSLKDSDFYPEIGDIIDWNQFYWELNSVTEPQLVSGHFDFKHQIKATAHRARLSSLQIEERPR